jgi:hypothetical protein
MILDNPGIWMILMIIVGAFAINIDFSGKDRDGDNDD